MAKGIGGGSGERSHHTTENQESGIVSRSCLNPLEDYCVQVKQLMGASLDLELGLGCVTAEAAPLPSHQPADELPQEVAASSAVEKFQARATVTSIQSSPAISCSSTQHPFPGISCVHLAQGLVSQEDNSYLGLLMTTCLHRVQGIALTPGVAAKCQGRLGSPCTSLSDTNSEYWVYCPP